MKKQKVLLIILASLAIVGIVDSSYITYEKLSGIIPPCSNLPFVDCGKVLNSPYSYLFGIPLSLFGLAHYATFLAVIGIVAKTKKLFWRKWMVAQSLFGFVFSLYLVYLQIGVIKAICIYCMISAINSFLLAPLSVWAYKTYEHSKKTPKEQEGSRS